ncbi:YdiU family protein [Comamonas faecalis]|uniref:Protein nucleotidyltransferase YdiU n=1 Tax=Comamonas faecalis TaxID=1387849 RepID=A0ABP7RMV7_9BURK
MPASAPSAVAAPALAWRHDGDFASLGSAFYTRLAPTPLPAPHWVARCDDVAALLELPAGWLASDEALQIFSGNATAPGSQPLASVYSGHQFGVWAGQLGDGRALWLGETVQDQEVQLKGSGRTPYSRGADGRAVLRSSIREYLASHALHALGIPTTRALCLVGSPQPVQRETLETAAVVTRVAPSFIRFGHFEHFAARRQTDELRRLADHVIERYYPQCQSANNPYQTLLQTVGERTAQMLAHWQAAGFCHGVMNTDNMSILGLTLDYGPFQFLDAFDPHHICNHSDRLGRYAFDRQPAVAYWNLLCLARALLPLIGTEDDAQDALQTYEASFESHYQVLMFAKLGLQGPPEEGDAALLWQLLHLLAAQQVDWTLFWRSLSQSVADDDFTHARDLLVDREGFDTWLPAYRGRIARSEQAGAAARMLRTNPRFALRNYMAEQAIDAARQGDFSVVHTLQTVLQHPFEERPDHADWAGLPPDWAHSIALSCSS